MDMIRINKFFKFNLFFQRFAYLFIIILFIAAGNTGCKNEAKTVLPAEYTADRPTDPNAGYYYPVIIDHYPKATDANIPINSKFIIIFNIPVNGADLAGGISVTSSSRGSLANPAQYTITPNSGYARSATITFSPVLSDNEVITVNIANTIKDAANNVPMPNSYSYSFTIPTGATPDTTVPVGVGVLVPVNGATGVSRDAAVIQMSFSERIDVTSVNSLTFKLRDDTNGVDIPATYSFVEIAGPPYSYVIRIIPAVQLNKSAVHTVTVAGIKDLSGNSFAGSSWSFTTAGTDPDPVAGLPVISDGPEVVSVGTDRFTLQWTTNEVTTYTIDYGRNTTVADYNANGADFLSSRSREVTVSTALPDDRGKRIWYRVSGVDLAGNSYTSAIADINLYTIETPASVHSGANAQYSLKTVPYNPPNVNSGTGLFWIHNTGTYTNIYGQVFNNIANKLWADPQPVFTESANFSYLSATDDGAGGMIVLALRSGNEIRVKRLNSSGAFVNWGSDADADTDSGLLIANGTKASAAIVYSGMVEQLISGTVDLNGRQNLADRFYEDADVDSAFSGTNNTLSDYVTNGDIFYDITTPANQTTLVKDATWDHEYILGQSSNIYSNGDSYLVANSTVVAGDAVRNHAMTVSAAYNENDLVFYTAHNYTIPAGITAGDLVNIGGVYARISSISAAITFTVLASGTETGDYSSHLYDASAAFSLIGALSQYDLVRDTTDTEAAVITSTTPFSDTDLTLSDSIFDHNENYSIHNRIVSNTAIVGSGGSTLRDWDGNFGTAAVNDYVVKVDASENIISLLATVSSIDTSPLFYDEITLSSALNFSSGERYRIYSQASLAASNADTYLLTNTSGTPFSGVLAGDLVRKTGTSTYAKVTASSNNVLVLDTDIYSGPAVSGSDYLIYHDYCSTHNDTDPIYQITLDHSITIADADPFNFYNTREVAGLPGTQLTWTAGWTTGTFPSNPIYDDEVDFTSILYGIAGGDLVFNYSQEQISSINGGYIHQYAMSLSGDIFPFATSLNNLYRVYGFNVSNLALSNVIDYGIAGGYNLNSLSDAGHFGSVNIGDIAFNSDDNRYAQVINKAGSVLDFTWDCFDTGNESYVIFNRYGVFYVWENSGSIYGKIMSSDSPGAGGPVQIAMQATLAANGSNPFVIPDGYGNAYVIYVATTGIDQIMAGFYNGAMTSLWAAHRELDTGIANNEAIIDVKSDGNGGAVVLYTYGTELKMQHITSLSHITLPPATTDISLLWTATGRSVTALANSQQSFAYDTASDSAVVAWNYLNNIWAGRINGTLAPAALQITNLGTVERDPSVYLVSGGTKALVTWDDSRFVANAGYGIFGIKLNINLGTGALTKEPAWNANTAGGTDDQNGVAIVLNNLNEYNPYPVLAPYNNGAGVLMFWADYRAGNASDLIYMNPFAPTYIPAW